MRLKILMLYGSVALQPHWLNRPSAISPARPCIQQNIPQTARGAADSLRKRPDMPEKETIERAREDEREGKAPSTQAGEFVREEMHHVREGKHGARSPQQAIAIGLSKARRAGVRLPPPKKGRSSAKVRNQASRDLRRGQKHR